MGIKFKEFAWEGCSVWVERGEMVVVNRWTF